MQNIVDYLDAPVVNGAATGVNEASNVRLALYGDYGESSMQDIANNEALAERQGVPYGVAMYDPTLKIEDVAQKIEKNPAADAWIGKDPSNVAFAKEDGKALDDTHAKLKETGLVKNTTPVIEQDAPRMGYNRLTDMGVRDFNSKVTEPVEGWNKSLENGNSLADTIRQQELMIEPIAWTQKVEQALLTGDMKTWEEFSEYYKNNVKELQKVTHDDPSHIWGGIGQVVRMVKHDIPVMLKEAQTAVPMGAMAGATTGGLVGAASGFGLASAPFAVAGATTGAVTGAFSGLAAAGASGGYKAAQQLEFIRFIGDMSQERDDAGNKLDPKHILGWARAYSAFVGLSEVTGEALVGTAFKPIATELKAILGSKLTKDAVKNAFLNKSVRAALQPLMVRLGLISAGEGGLESVQEAASIGASNKVINTNREKNLNYFREEKKFNTPENWQRIGESFVAGAAESAWMSVLPLGMKGAVNLYRVDRAKTFADANKELSKITDTSMTKEMSPKRMESYLQASGLNTEVTIPADALLQLQREGSVDITAMGWTEESLQQAAEAGQDVTASLAKLHSRYDSESMGKLADIMKESPDSMSLEDVQTASSNLNNDVDDAIVKYEREKGENNDIGVEAERIERELTDAVLSTPSLQAQIKSSADVNTTTGQYVRDIMRVIGQRAQRLSAMSGLPVSQILKRYNFRGVADAMRLKEQLAEFGMDKAKKLVHIRKIVDPDLQAAWGKVSRDEFVKQFGAKEAKQIDEIYGPTFWAKKGTGISPDKVAISAPEWHGDSRFGTRAPDEQVDMNEFWTGIMRTNEEVLGSNDVDAILQKYALDGDNIAQGATEGLLQSVMSGSEKLRVEWRKWRETVNNVYNERKITGKLPGSPVQMLTQTPLVMQLLGEDSITGKAAAEGGIYVNPHVFDDKHKNITPQIIKQLPKLLADPIAIFDSDTQNGDVVFMLSIKDEHGATVIVPMELKKKIDRSGVEINYAKTAYSKLGEKDGKKKVKEQWFVDQLNKNARYVNGQKLMRWRTAARVQFPVGSVSNAHGKTIRTEADLVNAREANPGLYQSKGKGKARGATWIDRENGNYVIELFNGANLSTVLHELGHVFTLEMGEMVKYGMADEQMMRDWDTLNTWTDELHKEEVLKKEYNKYQKDSVYNGKAWEDLTEQEKWGDVLDRARNEWFARGFEKWLSEGVAPSSKLQSMFHRFAKWLKRVYQQALDLDVNINDDVRGVFNRMLAADEEMDIAAEQAGINDFTKKVLDDLGLRGAERMKLEGLIADAKAEAADKMRRVRDVKYEEQRKRWEREAQEEINKNPVYQVRKSIRQKDNRLDWDEVVSLYGEKVAHDLNKAVPGCVARGAGNSIEQTAAEYGFDSGLAMAKAITEAKNPEQYKKDYVDERQREHDATFNPDDQLFEQPEIAEMQEEIAVALQAKIEKILLKPKYKAEQAGKTVNGEQITPTQEQYEDFGNRANWIATREVLKQRAAEALGKMTMQAQIKPENFRKSATFWMQKERNAILRGDWGKAIEANYKARMNLEMARLATERQKMVQRLQKQSKQAMESKDVSGGIRLGVFILCQKFNIQPEYTKKAIQMLEGKNILEHVLPAVRDLEDRGFLTAGTVDPDIFQDTKNNKPWQYMNWDEFSNIYESTLGLIKAERYRNYIDTVNGREQLDKLCKDLAQQITAGKKLRPEVIDQIKSKWGQKIDDFKDFAIYGGLNLDTQIFMCENIERGPLWQSIMRPINQATWKRTAILEKMTEKWKEMLGAYSVEEQRAMQQQYMIEADGKSRPMTRVRAIMILLNMGNEGNLSRLLAMKGVTPQYLEAAINSLQEKDINFVEGIWNYFETFKKESFDIEERCTKTRPKEVKPIPVATKFRTLKGGYFPIKYDADTSVFASDENEFGTVTNYMIPASVDHSFTKDRSEKTPQGRSLKLDSIMVIPEHLARVAHTLAFRETIHNVGRIINHPEVAKAIESTLGTGFYKTMVGNIKYIAGQRPAVSHGSKAISYFRKTASLAAMAWSLCTSLVQIAGGLTTINAIGFEYTMRGFGYSIKNGVSTAGFLGLPWRCGMYQQVCQKSAMMRHRIESIDREMFEAANEIDLGTTWGASGFKGWITRSDKWLKDNGFKIIGWTQMVTADMPTWQGAYLKAIEKMNMTEEEAIEYADSIVERTQVGGAEKNLSRWQQGSELSKALTLFYSYFGCLFNLLVRNGTMVVKNPSTAHILQAATLSLPMFLEPVLTGWASRKAPDTDDPEKWWKWAIKEAALNPFNMIPFVRDVASYTGQKAENNFAQYRPTPLADFVTNTEKAITEIHKVVTGNNKASGKKTTLATMRAIGSWTGNPLFGAQAVRITETTWDWLDKTTPEYEIGNWIRKRKKEK